MDQGWGEQFQGLSEVEAAKRLKRDGFNELQKAKRRTIFHTVFDVLKEPMLLLLVASGLLYFLIGSREEAGLLLFFVFVVIGLTVFQEQRSEKALEALKGLSSPRALVIRGGKQKRIPGREVVKGDLVFVQEGDRVPADGALLVNQGLMLNESILTGEALPVEKRLWDNREALVRPGGDTLPFVYGGTIVVNGYGLFEVQATGVQTEMGKIGASLKEIVSGDSKLKESLHSIVMRVGIAAVVVCLGVFLAYGLLKEQWLEGIIAGLALAMSLLPEEFPVVLSIFLALGAWRLTKVKVLARQVSAVEVLGSATVLCTDKTGTLTENRLELVKMATLSHEFAVEAIASDKPEAQKLATTAAWASRPGHPDPLEKAVLEKLCQYIPKAKLIEEFPIVGQRIARIQVWETGRGEQIAVAMGSPETIAQLCQISPTERENLLAQVKSWADTGLRVVAVAQCSIEGKIPVEPEQIPLQYQGILGFNDPVRKDVPQAIQDCQTAGIKVAVITGDYPGTARSIAEQIKLPVGNILTGSEITQLDPPMLRTKIGLVNIFARVLPEQKLQIVNAFKARREVVAMTGDGVNDAPALKSAQIGVAMGAYGTDVAREAADLVLLDDGFTALVAGIRQGRRIFDNIKKAVIYTLAVHIPIAGLPIISLILGWPLILYPAHIAFLELIIDPACALVFEAEPEEQEIMNRPPRPIKAPLFDQTLLRSAIWQGIISLLIVVAVFVLARFLNLNDAQARTMAFITLVIGNIGLILNNRRSKHGLIGKLREPNQYFWWVVGLTVFLLCVVIILPAARSIFAFSLLGWKELSVAVGAGILSWVVGDMVEFGSSQTKRA